METEVQRDNNKTKVILLIGGAEMLNRRLRKSRPSPSPRLLPSPSIASPKALLRGLLQVEKPAVLWFLVDLPLLDLA